MPSSERQTPLGFDASAYAHSLRTPVTAISGFAHLLSDIAAVDTEESLVGESQEFVQAIISASSDLAHTIDNLVVCQYLDAGTLTTSPDRTVVSDIVSLAGLTFPTLSIEPDQDRLSDPSLTVAGMHHHVKLVVLNLVSNAVIHGCGVPRLGVTGTGDDVTFVVSDSGPGLCEHVSGSETLRHITCSNESPQRLGLGLAVVSELCEAYGWTFLMLTGDDATIATVTIPRT